MTQNQIAYQKMKIDERLRDEANSIARMSAVENVRNNKVNNVLSGVKIAADTYVNNKKANSGMISALGKVLI